MRTRIPGLREFRRIRRMGSIALCVIGMSACAIGPAPRVVSPKETGIAVAYRTSLTPQGAVPAVDWWAAFADPTLLALLHEAEGANADLAVATQRLRQARVNLVAANGAFFPTLGGTVGRSRLSGGNATVMPGETTSVALTASYEIDLFGGKRRARTAAVADRDVSIENHRSVEISLLTEIAINYVGARAAGNRLRLAEGNLANQQDTLQLVRWRAMAGLASDVEVEQAAQLYAQTQASLPDLRLAEDGAINRLATLTGLTSGQVATRLGDSTTIPVASVPAVSLPVDALRQRPDVRAAEHSVIAELARVGVRQAAVLPSLILGGSYSGYGANWSAATLNPALQLTGLLAGSLFRGGQDWAAVESQKAVAAVAAANYRGVVRAAMEDLENSIRSASGAVEKTTALGDADAAAQRAVTLAQIRYRSGLTDFQSLLDTQRTALSSQQSLVQAQADQAIAAIRLYKALGGGWSTRTFAPMASE